MQGMNGIYGYIGPQGVQNLETYKYNGVDQSIIANLIMKHFWNWLIDNVVPVWIAPNLLTLCGFLSVFVANAVIWFYCPGLDGWAPNWVYFVAAVCVFAYQTLDNLDGKQARKTGSASALGEVFDHGADSLTVCFFVTVMGASFQLGPVLSHVSLIMLAFLFYFAHWENYFTGQLILRKFSNPTEGQLQLIALLLITAWNGTMWWRDSVDTFLFGVVERRFILFGLTVIGFFSTSYDHISTVYYHLKARNANLQPAIFAMVPMIVLFSFSLLWVFCAPGILIDHPRLFITTIGFLFAYLAIRLIVQNVTKEPFKIYYNMLSPIIVITFHSFIGRAFAPLLDDEFVLQLYFVVVLLHVSFLVISVVTEFCFYLNIRPFIITPKLAPPPDTLV